ncbi:MAG TPA: hypothetical protein VK815_18560 [Candidatus Acidoferrales bacterium]|jgi:hypothetical protein|nr:hypothetical protein [Candidatus Acidoferrales bacterium]
MTLDQKPVTHSLLLRYAPRLIVVILAWLGWYLGHWQGAIIGFVIGCAIGLLSWMAIYYFQAKARFQKQSQEISGLSDEQLKKIATDPTNRDIGFAIGELERRGIKNVHPSLESLFELLTSPNANQRALGMTLLDAFYPSTSAKIAKGSSSSDAPEVWRERISALNGAS